MPKLIHHLTALKTTSWPKSINNTSFLPLKDKKDVLTSFLDLGQNHGGTLKSSLGWKNSNKTTKKSETKFLLSETKLASNLTEVLHGSVVLRQRMGLATNQSIQECGTFSTWSYITWSLITIAKKYPSLCLW